MQPLVFSLGHTPGEEEEALARFSVCSDRNMIQVVIKLSQYALREWAIVMVMKTRRRGGGGEEENQRFNGEKKKQRLKETNNLASSPHRPLLARQRLVQNRVFGTDSRRAPLGHYYR